MGEGLRVRCGRVRVRRVVRMAPPGDAVLGAGGQEGPRG